MSGPLFVYAAPIEAGPLAARPDTLALGIGKAEAAVRLTARLAVDPPSAVVAFGVAGAHTGGPAVGSVVAVDRDVLLDEGVQTPTGFLSLAALGLPAVVELAADEALSARVAALLGVPRVAGCTVSTCSGVDALAAARLALLPAPGQPCVETMEGAAVALACAHFGVPWVGVRAVSNRTGDRCRAGWDLPAATGAVQAAVLRLMEML